MNLKLLRERGDVKKMVSISANRKKLHNRHGYATVIGNSVKCMECNC